VANLSKLAFADEEIHGFTETFQKILDMVEELEQVDTEGVPFTINVVDTVNYMREDEPIKGWDRDLLMENVPTKENGFIKVPAILEDGGDA
jgi:aspartyl-tRNA(Asn)/glutamyl-tRNA(Gln) amidotransferase subunit C